MAVRWTSRRKLEVVGRINRGIVTAVEAGALLAISPDWLKRAERGRAALRATRKVPSKRERWEAMRAALSTRMPRCVASPDGR